MAEVKAVERVLKLVELMVEWMAYCMAVLKVDLTVGMRDVQKAAWMAVGMAD